MEKREYKRIGYDLLTFLGDVGGLLDIVLVMGHMLTMFFAARLFQGALVGEAYKIQNYFTDFSQFYGTKKEENLTTESVVVSSSSESNDKDRIALE